MRLLKKQNLQDILFFDVETAPADRDFNENSPLYDAWYYDKLKEVDSEADLVPLYHSLSTLFPEYGRICAITLGTIVEDKSTKRGEKVILKSFYDDDEKVLLEDFTKSVTKFATNKTVLCGHNVLGFDIPFVMKRCIINGVDLHLLFDTAHLKPWETSVFDTALLWKGTGWKQSSLFSCTSSLGLPSSKDGIRGSEVGRAYYDGKIKEIVEYCEKDVLQTINLFMKMRYDEPFDVFFSATDYKPEPKKILNYLFEGGQYDESIEAQLKGTLSKLSKKDKAIAIEILNCIPTKAQGKETFIDKKDIAKL